MDGEGDRQHHMNRDGGNVRHVDFQNRIMVWLAVHMNPIDVQALLNMLDHEDEDDNNDNQESRDVIVDEDIVNMDVSNQGVNNDSAENMLLDVEVDHLNNQDSQNDDETRDGPYVINSEYNTENLEEAGAAVEVSTGIKQDQGEEGSLLGPSRKMPSTREEQNVEDEEFKWWDEFAEISIASSSDCDSDIYQFSEIDETQYQPADSIKAKDNPENPGNIFHIINNDFAQSSSNIDLAADECSAERKKEDVKQKVEHSQPGRSRKRPRVEDGDESRGRKKQRKCKHLQ